MTDPIGYNDICYKATCLIKFDGYIGTLCSLLLTVTLFLTTNDVSSVNVTNKDCIILVSRISQTSNSIDDTFVSGMQNPMDNFVQWAGLQIDMGEERMARRVIRKLAQKKEPNV